MGFGRQCRGVDLRGDGQAVGQRDGPARVVPLVHAVGRRRLVLPADGLVRAAGHRVGQAGRRRRQLVGRRRRVVARGQLGARGLRHAAAAEGGDAAAVAAGEDGGVGDQAGGLALSGRGREGWHCGLEREQEQEGVTYMSLF